MPTLILVFFWIIVIWLLIFLFYLLKKYLGRVIIICVFVLLLYGIYWLINPAGARGIFDGIVSLPTTTIRAINNRFSKDTSTTGQNNQEIWSVSGVVLLTWDLQTGNNQLGSNITQNDQLTLDQLDAEIIANTTDASRLNTTTDKVNSQTTTENTSNVSISVSTSGSLQQTSEKDKYIFSAKDYKVSMNADGNILVEKRDNSVIEEDEDDGSYDVIESNPRKDKKSDSKTTDNAKSSTNKKSSRWLSSSDLNEASQIFNF